MIVPAKECARTIPGVLRHTTGPLVDAGLVDDVVVVDAGSDDGTARFAAHCGARVLQQDQIVLAARPGARQG